MPKTTLTQRRNQISSGAKKLTKDKLDHYEETDAPDRSAVIKIVIWILVVVFIGVGAALFISNLNSRSNRTNTTPPANQPDSSPDSFPASLPEDEEPTDTPVETPTETPAEAPTTPPATGDSSWSAIAEYGTQARSVAAKNNDNSFTMNKFRFAGTSSEFNYTFWDLTGRGGELDPGVKAYYEENNLIVEISNVYRDNVTGNGGKTNRTFIGVTGISGTETENSNNVSKYKFLMDKQYPYRINLDTEKRELTIQIDNK